MKIRFFASRSMLFCGLVLLLISSCCHAQSVELSVQPMQVIYPKPKSASDIREAYFFKLIELSLSLTKGEYGAYQLTHSPENFATGRYPYLVRDGVLLTIMTSPATQELEQSMASVHVPLLKGIQGLRIALVNKGQMSDFANVDSLAALKRKVYGQGVSWVDTQILQNAGFNVLTTPIYNSLFSLVEMGRIDAFPRGINEVFKEYAMRKQQFPSLAVEQELLLYYPMFVHFYVNKNNTLLHERLYKGLLLAIQSGRFDALFNAYFAEDIQKANLDKRRMFVLDNAYSPKTLAKDYDNLLHPVIQNGLAASAK